MREWILGRGVTIGQKYGTRPILGKHCTSNAPLKLFYHKKGGEKRLKGGLYETSDKFDDPDDFQFIKESKEGKSLDVCDK